MKLSLVAMCLASIAVADQKLKGINGYCVEHASQALSGTFAEGDCRKESKKCSVKEAIKKCEKLAACTGVTCYDKNKKKCVVHSSMEFAPAGAKVSTWMRSDNLCAETRVPSGGGGGKKDKFEMDDMLMMQMMNGGRPIDPNTAMLFGAQMDDLMMMEMMSGGDGSVAGDIDPTVIMLTGGDIQDVMMMDMMAGGDGSVAGDIDPAMMMLAGGDMKDMMMINAMSGGKSNAPMAGPEPIGTVNGVRCASGATRIVETSEGPKRVCAPAIPGATTTLTTGTSGVRCMYGTRVVTTADGNTVTVCATRPVSTTITGEVRAMGSDEQMVAGTSETKKELGLKGKLRRRRRIAAKKLAEAAAAAAEADDADDADDVDR